MFTKKAVYFSRQIKHLYKHTYLLHVIYFQFGLYILDDSSTNGYFPDDFMFMNGTSSTIMSGNYI